MSSDADSAFFFIRPVVVTDAVLTSSNVPELPIAEYASGTAYGLAARAGVSFGNKQTVYESIQAANIGHAPAASPAWWRVVGVVYGQYNPATSYPSGERVSDVGPDKHLLYESMVAGNVGQPLTDSTKWLALGATNARSMFDKVYNSQTTNAESITLTLAPGRSINSLALLNIEGATVTVTQSISGYSRIVSLNRHPVINWYDFYYEDIVRETDLLFTDIPPFPGGVLTITISSPGGIAACGLCVIGKRMLLGITQTDLTRSINDFSGAGEDKFGGVVLIKRAYSKRMNFDFLVADGLESEVTRQLEAWRATELVIVASAKYSMTFIYGFFGPWSVPISYTGKLANIDIKGLI